MSSGFVHSGKKTSSKRVYSGLGNWAAPLPKDESPGMIVFDPNVPERNPEWPTDDDDSGSRTRDDRRDTDGGGHRYPDRDDPGGDERDGDTDHPNDDGGNGCTGILGCRDDDGGSDGGSNDGGDSDGGSDEGDSNGGGSNGGGSDDGGSDDGGSNDGDSNSGGSSDDGSNSSGSNGGGYTPTTQNPGSPAGIDMSALQAFYNDNKVAVWSGGGVLALLLLLK